jgi:hypothetical protein
MGKEATGNSKIAIVVAVTVVYSLWPQSTKPVTSAIEAAVVVQRSG